MSDDDDREMEKAGFKVRRIRCLDGDGQTWITIDVLERKERPRGDSSVPSEPTTGPPTG